MNEKQIDDYLFNEMSAEEREKFEDRFLDDDDLFFEIADRENELVDSYNAGRLEGAQLDRFERSLIDLPARREKISKSKLLREFISKESSDLGTITIAERRGVFSRIADLFTFNSTAFQFASIGLILILAIGSIFLLKENRRLGSIQDELAASRARESELLSQVSSQQEASSDLTADLDAERQRIQRLEAELEKMRTTNQNVTQPNRPVAPTIATLILVSVARRGGQPIVERLQLAAGVSRISTIVYLPDADPAKPVSIKLNGETIADRATVITGTIGKHLQLTIPVTKVKDGPNRLTVFDTEGRQVDEYQFLVERKK